MAYPDLKTYFLDFLLTCADSAMEIPEGSAPDDKRGWLEREIERQYTLIRAAVNQIHAPWDTPVGPDDEVALFPPVCGG